MHRALEPTGLVSVASLIATAPADAVLAAAARELARGIDGALAVVSRHDGERSWPVHGAPPPPGGADAIAAAVERGGPVRVGGSDVAAAILVAGATWGALSVHAPATLPAGTEARAAELAALAAAALAAEDTAQRLGAALARADALTASRERLLAATDAARRGFERTLHRGAQQQLVTLGIELRLAEGEPPETARPRIARAAERAEAILEELRALSRSLHPAILAEGGLRPALRALARRSDVPVKLHLDVDRRFEEAVELAAYHAVAEALRNVAAHAGATRVDVGVEATGDALRVVVADDGRGGADPARGSGLTSLEDRVGTLGGVLTITSDAGAGTTVAVELPARAR